MSSRLSEVERAEYATVLMREHYPYDGGPKDSTMEDVLPE